MKLQGKIVGFAILGSLVVALSACSRSDVSSDTTEATPADATNPYGAGLIDPPQPNESVLEVDVRGTVTKFAIEALQGFPATTVELFEPFIKARSNFTGVSLSDLFHATGIQPDDIVDTLALNEYRYVNTAGEFTASDGLLAYEQDGHSISVDRGGPIRIVFPDGSPLSGVLDAWIWALSSITIR